MNKKWIALALGAALLAAGRSPCGASWEDEKQEWEKLSGSRVYKDPGYAAKLSLSFLPVDNGHFYVGEVGKGIWFSVGETVSLAAVAVPFFGAQSRSKLDKDPAWTDGMIITAAAGGLGYLALKVWSAYDAAAGARRFNEAVERKFQQKQGFRFHIYPRGAAVTRRWG